jgi:hypothetical protein
MNSPISLIAGSGAIGIIRDEGLKPDRIRVVTGAAGGPKWLILGGLDRALFGSFFTSRKKPLFLLGSSIGSWRFAAVSRKDPIAAIDRFEAAYLDQYYSRMPTTDEVSGASWRILDDYLDDTGIDEVLSHRYLRLGMLAVRSRNLFRGRSRAPLAAGMAAATLSNLVSRSAMGLFFDRTLFYDPREKPPCFEMDGFRIHRVPLSKSNTKQAIMASGSIPLVMNGVTGIPGAPAGTYRDGGMIDYQLDIAADPDQSHIVLYPHYTDTVIPGWLDKHLPWRRAGEESMKNVLIVCPSREFIESLPYNKIPDRNDFMKFHGRDAERIAYWKKTIAGGHVLAGEFMEAVESGRIRTMVTEYSSRR